MLRMLRIWEMGRESIMRMLSLLNVLWDGGTHSVGRKTSESYIVRGAAKAGGQGRIESMGRQVLPERQSYGVGTTRTNLTDYANVSFCVRSTLTNLMGPHIPTLTVRLVRFVRVVIT